MIISNDALISFLVPAKNASSFLENTIKVIHTYFSTQYAGSFEIVIIPNGPFNCEELDKTIKIAKKLENEYSNIFVVEHDLNKHGKGAALKTGFLASKGEWIFFTDADLPYDLDFFTLASKKLQEGYDFVSGNRRTPESYFTVPVKILPFVYNRHICGLLFNKVVRHLFGIKSHDTQAGIKAMKRSLAKQAFDRQACPGFLFDIEFFLVASKNKFKKIEIPVHLHLKDEKTTINILKEMIKSIYWLSRIFLKNFLGHYKVKEMSPLTEYSKNCLISADDWGLSPAVNRGILKLAQNGIVNRVSILVDSSSANLYMDELKKIENIEIGLHFNLTLDTKHNSPGKFLIFTLNPLVSPREKKFYIRQQLERQLNVMKSYNIKISHIDGHHHCHIFPYTAAIVSQTAMKNGITKTRLPTEASLWKSTKFILPLLSIFARREFNKSGMQYRPFFYPSLSLLKNTEKFKNILQRKNGFEVIVHPADENDLHLNGCLDNYNQQRVVEFDSLSTLMLF